MLVDGSLFLTESLEWREDLDSDDDCSSSSTTTNLTTGGISAKKMSDTDNGEAAG